MKLWLDDSLIDAGAAGIRADDRGLLLGDGLYETLLVRDGRPQRLEAHLARLCRGAAVIGLPLPAVDIGEAMRLTVAANDLSDGSLRLTVTRGGGPRGLAPPPRPRPTIMITAAAAAPPPAPARCVVATRTRRNERTGRR